MKKHLTRFLPLSRPSDCGLEDSKPRSAFSRVQDHVEELRRYFELPNDELFLEEFYCALSKRILLQGRMYIFEHYLCFYSNVFGWVKQKVIPLRHIDEITKKRNYGFPNSIEVIWKSKKEFFTSFLNRNDAFELLHDAVRHARETEDASPDADGSERDGAFPSTSSSTASTASRMGSIRSPTKRPGKRDSDPVDDDSDLGVNEDDIDVWSVISGSAPVIPDNMELLCGDRFDVSVQEFFTRTLSMDSMFLDEYHKRRGDTRYRMSEWEQLHEISGFVRQATFVSPVKGVGRIGFISPKNTECNQDHRLCIYQGDHLVFQISQVMKDIPYGDNFSVEIRWDVTPAENENACRISIHVAVPFIRSVMAPFKSLIESNVKKEMQESVKIMTEMLRDALSTSSQEIDAQQIGVDRSENDELESSANLRTVHVRSKLQNLLTTEEGVHRVEQFLGSSELLQGIQPTAAAVTQPDVQPPTAASHQTTTTMNFQAPITSTVNWVLFFCCLFMLFCQVMLILLWTVVPPWQPMPAFERMDTLLEHPIKQLQELEVTLIAVLQGLNATLAEIKLYG